MVLSIENESVVTNWVLVLTQLVAASDAASRSDVQESSVSTVFVGVVNEPLPYELHNDQSIKKHRIEDLPN